MSKHFNYRQILLGRVLGLKFSGCLTIRINQTKRSERDLLTNIQIENKLGSTSIASVAATARNKSAHKK